MNQKKDKSKRGTIANVIESKTRKFYANWRSGLKKIKAFDTATWGNLPSIFTTLIQKQERSGRKYMIF